MKELKFPSPNPFDRDVSNKVEEKQEGEGGLVCADAIIPELAGKPYYVDRAGEILKRYRETRSNVSHFDDFTGESSFNDFPHAFTPCPPDTKLLGIKDEEDLIDAIISRPYTYSGKPTREYIKENLEWYLFQGNDDLRWILEEQRFKGQIVVDLGAGEQASGYELATAMGAKAYIGVEKYNYVSLEHEIEKVMKQGREELIPAAIIRNDMISFLDCLPNKSVSILACGLDSTILRSREYRLCFKKEMKRVLSPDGGCVTCGSAL